MTAQEQLDGSLGTCFGPFSIAFTDWKPDALRTEGASDEIIAALDTVTRRHDETYSEFIKRAARNEIGCAVKVTDLYDNLDLSRIAQPTQADLARMDRYRAALQQLGYQLPELSGD